MTCNNCARKVAEAVQAVPGVDSATVSVTAGRVAVRWRGAATAVALIQAIERAGFAAQEVPSGAPSQADHPHWQWNLWLGGVVTAGLMLGEWAFGLGARPAFQWFSFVAAAAVQVFAGAQFYRGAWRQLKAGGSNMDTLVALGSTTAFGYSTWALFTGGGGHLYFMEAAAIITLISLGHWIEAQVSTRAESALKSLLELAPLTARRVGQAVPAKLPGPGFDLRQAKFAPVGAVPTETEVPVSELQPGDLVALRPGDRIPVDGVVTEGESAVNEAMLTGEALPQDKQQGSALFAGTLNVTGRLTFRVTATGEATALAHIIAAVRRAQTSRTNLQRLGDRVSNVFVPVVVLIALVAGLAWGFAPTAAQAMHDALAPFLWPAHPPTGAAAGFIIAAAVLIIACPCAMGLATPAAIMASANAAAARGILIRDGVALEKAGQVSAVIFDKAGTLTQGQLAVAEFASLATVPVPQRHLGVLAAGRGAGGDRRRRSTAGISAPVFAGPQPD
jgi:Cu+-exporting ATPase